MTDVPNTTDVDGGGRISDWVWSGVKYSQLEQCVTSFPVLLSVPTLDPSNVNRTVHETNRIVETDEGVGPDRGFQEITPTRGF